MTSAVPSAVIVQSYRQLYRAALQAVQYSAPARFTARARLRHAYRTRASSSYDQQRIDNTLEFLRGAAKQKGTEHRIVKNVLQVLWWEDFQRRRAEV